jgi:ABC-type branched-subunit amino acid transport system permease subunit
MRGNKNQRTFNWWGIGTVPVALLVMFTARDHGAPFWLQLVIVAAVAAVLGLIIGLAIRAVHRRPGH